MAGLGVPVLVPWVILILLITVDISFWFFCSTLYYHCRKDSITRIFSSSTRLTQVGRIQRRKHTSSLFDIIILMWRLGHTKHSTSIQYIDWAVPHTSIYQQYIGEKVIKHGEISCKYCDKSKYAETCRSGTGRFIGYFEGRTTSTTTTIKIQGESGSWKFFSYFYSHSIDTIQYGG